GQAGNRQRGLLRGQREPERRPGRRAARPVVEAAVRARVAGEWLEEVVGRVDRLRLLGVLALPAHAEEHQVAGARRELLAPEELLRAPADRQLAYRVLHAVQDGLGERLGLVDRRHGLRLVADILPVAVELWRV